MNELIQTAADVVKTTFGMAGTQFTENFLEKSGESEELVLRADFNQVFQEHLTNKLTEVKENYKKEISDPIFKAADQKATERFMDTIREKAGIEDKSLSKEELIESILKERTKIKEVVKEGVDFKANPEFVKYEKQLRADYESKLSEKEQAINQTKSTWENKYAFDKAFEIANRELSAKKPVIREDEAGRVTQFRNYRREFEDFNFKFVDGTDEAHLFYKSGENAGKRLEDSTENPILLKQFIEDAASRNFVIPVQGAAGSSGNTTARSGGNSMTDDRKEKLYQDANSEDAAVRNAAMKALADLRTT